VTIGLFVGFGIIVGFPVAGISAEYFLFPLGGAAGWAVACGPIFLVGAISARRTRRRVSHAFQALPAHHGTDRALPGYAEESMGIVIYRDGRLLVITPQGPAVDIPFCDIEFVEELPPKGFSHFSGIDVHTTSGQWTEIRLTDNTELLAVLEKENVPAVRAVNHLWFTTKR
jgi:hypothetical protein